MKTFADFNIDVPASAHGEYRALCPQCSGGRKKSLRRDLAVDVENGVWLCHHCGWKGGLGGMTDSERARAEKHFKTPIFNPCPITDERVIEWFARRGISETTLAAFKITAAPTQMMSSTNGKWETVLAMQFPYYVDGQCVNVKYRTSDKRFRQAKDARKVLYNYDGAMAGSKATKMLIVTEGEMDVLALFEAGFHNAVSVPDGAPAPDAKTYTSKFDFLAESEALVHECDTYVLAVDNDGPGLKLRDELARRLGVERCLKVTWPEGCKDANDVLMHHGAEALNRCIHDAVPFPIQGVKSGRDLWDALFDLHANPEQPGADIGWAVAKDIWNVETGQMTVVTGIPSHGKSTWIDALRINLLKNYGWKSAAFSPENWPVERHFSTLSEMYAGINFHGMSEDELYNAAVPLVDSLFFISPESDEDMMTVDAILAAAKALVFRAGIKVLVIDPWNEIEHDIPPNQREDQYISVQLAKIRRFARTHDIHIFLIAHPHMMVKDRDGKYPPPTAYDIAGGAMWNNKADNILCVYRTDMNTSETAVFVQKVRFRRNGKKGRMLFDFDPSTSTYYGKQG